MLRLKARYGYSRQEILGRTVHDLRIWDDPADRRLLVTQLRRGGPIRNVLTRLREQNQAKSSSRPIPPTGSNSTGKGAYWWFRKML